MNSDGTISGTISGSGGTLAKKGAGTLTLSGANSYTSATGDDMGTMILNGGGSLAGTNVTVGTAATITPTTGNATLDVQGNYTIGNGAAGTLDIAAGNGTTTGQGTLSLVDGTAGNILTLSNTNTGGVLTLGSTTSGLSSVLDLEVGNGVADEIKITSGQLSLQGAVTVNITGLGGFSNGTQTLISAGTASGSAYAIGANGFSLSATGNFGGYTLTLGSTTSKLTVTEVANTSPTTAYYDGGAAASGGDTALNSFTGGNNDISNFSTTSDGQTNANGLIGPTSNLYFAANNITTAQNVTLGQDFTVNSVNFTGTNTVATPVATTLGGNNLLTINATSSYTDGQSTPVTYAAGTGLVVQSGAAANTISSNVALGNSQTWEIDNSPGQPLTIRGVISGGNKALTKTGLGRVIFAASAANTYTGPTSVNAGELDLDDSGGVAVAGNLNVGRGSGSPSVVKLLAANQIATTSAVTVNSDGTLALNGNDNTVASLTSTGGTITGGGTLTSNGAITFNGTSTTSTIGAGASVSGSTQATLAASDILTANGTLDDALSAASGAGINGTGEVGAVTLSGDNTLSSSSTLTTSGIAVNGTGNAISSGTVTGASR